MSDNKIDPSPVSMTATNTPVVPTGGQPQTSNSGSTQTTGFTQPKLLDAHGLLEALFEPSCRPSLRWLRQHQGKAIPIIRMGRRVFFDLGQVQRAIERKHTFGLMLTRTR